MLSHAKNFLSFYNPLKQAVNKTYSATAWKIEDWLLLWR